MTEASSCVAPGPTASSAPLTTSRENSEATSHPRGRRSPASVPAGELIAPRPHGMLPAIPVDTTRGMPDEIASRRRGLCRNALGRLVRQCAKLPAALGRAQLLLQGSRLLLQDVARDLLLRQ